MPVFRYIEKANMCSYHVSTFIQGRSMYYAADCDTMIVSDLSHVFTINWVVNGKLNDLYYWSTPSLREIKEQSYFLDDRYHSGKIKLNHLSIDIIKDNPFFLIFLSQIFDSPIKKRILQFLSYIYFFESLMMAPFDQTDYYQAEFVKNLDIDNRRMQCN